MLPEGTKLRLPSCAGELHRERLQQNGARGSNYKARSVDPKAAASWGTKATLLQQSQSVVNLISFSSLLKFSNSSLLIKVRHN